MGFLDKKIELNVLTLILIVVGTGVMSAHIAQSEFGVQSIPEIVAVIGLALVGLGIWMFLGLFQQLYGKKTEEN
ncbi:MAG: hypothetical protein Q9M08_08760 [Mariprofundus sp.]|nr:hypothetical protein [Mariprofundus sp.]